MTPALNTIAVAAVAGLAVGAVSGAWVNGGRWAAKLAKMEKEQAIAMTEAQTHVREIEKQLSEAGSRLPPAVRVRCESAAPAAGLPTGGADASVGGGGPVPADRDYGPALRECLILQRRAEAYESLRKQNEH
ncbi:MAG TPA: hypothetical protein PKA50_03505 [Gemmatimonadales bacterium]|nr:hypothetical protein [Gemmatimonadales bacterium]